MFTCYAIRVIHLGCVCCKNLMDVVHFFMVFCFGESEFQGHQFYFDDDE